MRNLIRAISHKINTDSSSRGHLVERNKTLGKYMEQHKDLVNSFYTVKSARRSKSAK